MLSYTAYRLQLAAWLNCNWGGGVDCFLCISNTFIWKGIVRLSWVLEGGSEMSVIPFCIDFCAFSTLLCENPPKEHFVSKLTGALSPGGGGSKLSIFPFCIDFCAFSTLSCETPPKVHFVSKLTGMSNFERNPFRKFLALWLENCWQKLLIWVCYCVPVYVVHVTAFMELDGIKW